MEKKKKTGISKKNEQEKIKEATIKIVEQKKWRKNDEMKKK